MRLIQNEESASGPENYIVRLTKEEFEKLDVLLNKAPITIEPAEPKKDIQPYQGFFNRRIKERRSQIVSRRAGERCTPCGRRTLVFRRKS